jgi:hypothetical protein
MVFFKEWKDSMLVKYWMALFTIIMIALFMFLYINFPDQYYHASIYYNMVVLATAVLAMDFVFEKNWLFSGVGFGKSIKHAVKTFLLGAAVMAIASLTTFSISAPLTATIAPSTLTFIYTVIAAPYIEEKFFRDMANYTCGKVFMGAKLPHGDILGVLFSSGCFALFHGYTFGWNYWAMFEAFVFAIAVSVGNQLCKSSSFSFGAHFMNNLLVYMRW